MKDLKELLASIANTPMMEYSFIQNKEKLKEMIDTHPHLMIEAMLETVHDSLDKNSFMRKFVKKSETPTGAVPASTLVCSLESYWDFEDLFEDVYVNLIKAEDTAFLSLISKYKYHADEFTIDVFGKIKSLNAEAVLIPFHYWPDIKCDSRFSPLFNPVHSHELVLTGYLGDLAGVKIYTDGYRQSDAHVLEDRHFYAIPKISGSYEVVIREESHTDKQVVIAYGSDIKLN
jgi:hypothetical protein